MTTMFTTIGCGKSGDKDLTTFLKNQKVQELAENVDKVPNGTAMTGVQQTQLASVSTNGNAGGVSTLNSNNAGGTTGQIKLLSDSSDQEIAITPQYFELSDGYNYKIGSELNRYNSMVSGAKSFKNELLTMTVVTQYDVWVYRFDNKSSKVRLHYDANLDVLTMEEIFIGPNGTSYRKVVSSYDINGNIVIDSYKSEYQDGILTAENNFHYNENVIYSLEDATYSYNQSSNRLDKTYHLVEFVLEEGKEQTTMMTYNYSIKNYEQTDEIRSISGNVSTIRQENGYKILYTKNLSSSTPEYTTRIFDSNGHTVASLEYRHTGENKISVTPTVTPLYILQGYDKLYKNQSADTYYLTKGTTQIPLTRENLKYENLEIIYYTLIEDTDIHLPSLMFYKCAKEYEVGSNFNTYNYLSTYFDTLGLSFKDTNLKTIFDFAQNSHDYIDTDLSAFGLTSFDNISYDVFMEMFKSYQQYQISYDEIETINNGTIINYYEQTSDDTKYQRLNLKDEVEVVIDAVNGTMDLSNINITIPKKQLFVEGNQYRLIVALTSATHSIELGYKEVLFNNDSMNFTGFTSVTPDVNDIKEDEQYTLSIYLAGNTSEGYLRMTNDIKIKYTNFQNFELSTKQGNTPATLSFKYTDKLIMKVTLSN